MRSLLFIALFGAIGLNLAEAQSTRENTVITGIAWLPKYDGYRAGDIVVEFYAGNERLGGVRSHNGLFYIDLGGRISPKASVRIVVPEQEFRYGKGSRGTIPRQSHTVQLKNAQNIDLQLKFDIKYNPTHVNKRRMVMPDEF